MYIEHLFMCEFFVLAGDSGPSERKKSKMCCSYGENCYRRNPTHFTEYLHPHCELKLCVLQEIYKRGSAVIFFGYSS